MRFGASLQAARKAAGLTQQQLAELVGVKQTSVTGWEADKYRPGHAFLVKLAEHLNLDLAEMLILAAEPLPTNSAEPLEASA
jgi:transcriptional regulator with XRE-family HTH domain